MNFIPVVGAVSAAVAGAEGLSVVGVGAAATLSLPVTIGIVAGGLTVAFIVSYFARKLKAENQTMRDIQAHLALEEEIARIKRMNDEKMKELEDERRRNAAEITLNRGSLEAMAKEKKRKAKERTRVLQEEIEGRRKQEEAMQEQKKRLAEEEERIAERGRALQECIIQASHRLEEERKCATTGVQPVQWPSAEEFHAAREKVQYSHENFHFAIVGNAGCGKSSLINAFLNLKSNDKGAAHTGITETTLEISRYPDPGTQEPRPWTVWFDVPGAGTQRISHWQYFTTQALFVFDIIILAFGDRFGETDCQIARSCREFKIPFFIVRSKADQHIRNMMLDEDENYQGPPNNGELYQRCCQTFIDESQATVSEELSRAELPDQRVYCVSNRALRKAYNGSLQNSTEMSGMIHEMTLVKDLMLAAYQRRCGDNDETANLKPGTSIQERTVGWAKAAYTTTAGIARSTIGLPPTQKDQQERQPGRVDNTPAKRVLYLPKATTLDGLRIELEEQNPGLSRMFAVHPRLLTPTTAVLYFHHTASIPPQISAFGKVQQPTMYREKARKTGKASNVGTSVHSLADTPSGSSNTGTDTKKPRRRRR